MNEQIPVPLSSYEQARRDALAATGILDTLSASASDDLARFDDLARLAGLLCQTPSAFVAFGSGRDIFFQASIGAEDMRAAVQALLSLTLEAGQTLVIPDMPADPRFQNHSSESPVRFYAGVALCDPNGVARGVLCVADRLPHAPTAAQTDGLRALGHQGEALLALRRVTVSERQAQAEARRIETQMQGVTDALPVLIAYVDTEQRYRFNNRAYEQWVGLPQEQITGRTLREVLGEEFYGVVAGDVAAALRGETITYERDMVWPDGTTRFVRGTYAPQRGADGAVHGFAVLVTDETERRRREAEQRAASERHATLIAAQQEVAHADRDLDAVLRIITRHAQDMTGADGAVVEMADGEDMVYRAASGTAADHIGLRLRRATSLSGRCVAEGRLLCCDDTETDPRVDREACRRIGVRSMVVVPLLFLGQTIGVLKVYSAAPHAFPSTDLPLLELMVSLIVATMSAVSEAEARSALSSSEQRLAALISSVPVILFALDEHGIFTEAEGKGLAALGLAPGELVGRSYREAYADAPALLENIAQGLAGEARQWLAEVSDLCFETQCLPLKSADGKASGLIGVAFDVTERIRAERALRQSAARQRQFLRDVLASVTEGRLILCQTEADLPSPLSPWSGPIPLTAADGLRALRQAAGEACHAAGLSEERGHDMITAVSEAGMNCVVHVGSGVGQVCVDERGGVVQVRVVDHGRGIALENLPHATLKKGYSSAGTLGHGMKMMLQTADRVYLLTGPSGTTVAVEQERVAPLPVW